MDLLTNAEMAAADRAAVVAGIASLNLMEAAGRAVATVATEMARRRAGPIVILCGPGNNGGDGFVAARLLRNRGFDVELACLVPADQLKGDAAIMAARWGGEALPPSAVHTNRAALIVDALFGAGLARPLDEAAAELVKKCNAHGNVLAVDIPSGVSGDTGETMGPAIEARRTVTFFRKKPGHLLLPGRALCGELTVAEIGIPPSVLAEIRPLTNENVPALWTGQFPRATLAAHKYKRGHAVVVSGPAGRSGAARLGARGALRIGAGLVTVASPEDAVAENAAQLTAIMLRSFRASTEHPFAPGIAQLLEDKRINAVLIGPGNGVGRETVNNALAALENGAAVVLDADAFTAFAGPFDFDLFRIIKANPTRPVVMTPHEGEFARVPAFQGSGRSKLERARAVAERSGAVLVLKGPDTVIASPDGRAAINANAPSTLATAGSGDVLAGFITGLLAQHMPAYEAACAAVWLHGECANLFGPGLIAEDLPEMLPRVLAAFYA